MLEQDEDDYAASQYVDMFVASDASIFSNMMFDGPPLAAQKNRQRPAGVDHQLEQAAAVGTTTPLLSQSWPRGAIKEVFGVASARIVEPHPINFRQTSNV